MVEESKIHDVVTLKHGSPAGVVAAVNASKQLVQVNDPAVAPAVHLSHINPSQPVQVNDPGVVVDGLHARHPNAGDPAVPAAEQVVQSNDPGVVDDGTHDVHTCCPGVAA